MSCIEAICCALPNNKISNDFFFNHLSESYIKSTTKVTGIENRYWSVKHTSLSLCIDSAKVIFKNFSEKYNKSLKDELELLVFITQTPEELMPSIAYKAHETLNINDACSCITINSGCTAFVDGIGLTIDLMQNRGYKNCLLLIGDVLSKNIDLNDSSTAPIFGDCGSATLLTNNNIDFKYAFASGTKPNSSNAISLSLPNKKNKKSLKMKGMEVFNFTINGIPNYIDKVTYKWENKYSSKPSIDYYIMHQANKMILNHISKKVKIPSSKIPINIEHYGNTSGCSIPLLICDLFEKGLNINNSTILLCGFGVGLSWSSLILNSININFTKIIKV